MPYPRQRLVTGVQATVTDLLPRHSRSLHALGAEWYRQIYHTQYQLPSPLHGTAVCATRAKETNKAHNLKDAPASQSFDEYQVSKAKTQTTSASNVGQVDADDDDDLGLQQALLASGQQSQPQGSDPTAASSAAVQRSIQQELYDELEVGQNLDGEAGQLEQKLHLEGLTIDELERFRKISQLKNTNMLRVAELCEQRIHENRAQQLQIELSNCRQPEHLLINCSKVSNPVHHRDNPSNRNPPVLC